MLFTCCNLSATLKSASLCCECSMSSGGIRGLDPVARMSLCQQSYTNTQSCTCTGHVQECDRKQRIIHMFADRLLFSYLLTSILSSPACCTPISPLLSPASMYGQVRGCLVYKRPGEFASEEAQKCTERTFAERVHSQQCKKWKKTKTTTLK